MAYTDTIIEATGCTLEVAKELEIIMRETVFHSTLDWQTKEELTEGAKLAVQIYNELKAESEPQVVLTKEQQAKIDQLAYFFFEGTDDIIATSSAVRELIVARATRNVKNGKNPGNFYKVL